MGGGGPKKPENQNKLPWEGGNPVFDSDKFKDTLGGSAALLMNKGPNPFEHKLYTGFGSNTSSAMDSIVNKANSVQGLGDGYDFARSQIGGSNLPGLYEQNLMGTARGDNLDAQDPRFNAALDRATDRTMSDINAKFSSFGRGLSDTHTKTLASEIGNLRTNAELAEVDKARSRQMNAIGAINQERDQRFNKGMSAASSLPALYQSQFLPESQKLKVGQMQDSDRLQSLLADKDLFDRSSELGHLQQFMGMNPSNYEAKPKSNPFMDVLGFGMQALPFFL